MCVIQTKHCGSISHFGRGGLRGFWIVTILSSSHFPFRPLFSNTLFLSFSFLNLLSSPLIQLSLNYKCATSVETAYTVWLKRCFGKRKKKKKNKNNILNAARLIRQRYGICWISVYFISDAGCWWSITYSEEVTRPIDLRGRERRSKDRHWCCTMRQGGVGWWGWGWKEVRGRTANGLEKNLLVSQSWRCFNNG